MKKRILLPFMAVIAAIACGYIGIQEISGSENNYCTMLDQNIEALTEPEQTQTVCKWLSAQDNYGCPIHICSINGNGNECSPCGAVAKD